MFMRATSTHFATCRTVLCPFHSLCLLLLGPALPLRSSIRFFPPHPDAIEIEVNDGSREERQQLAYDESANDRNAQRTPEFGSGSRTERQRQGSEQRRHRRHQNRTEAQNARFEDGIARVHAVVAFFFTSPISRMIPIMAMTLRSVFVIINASNAPPPAEGSVERIVIG